MFLRNLLYCWLLTATAWGQWKVQPAQTEAHFRAVHAVSAKVCWIGGTKGQVLRTQDGGTNWEIHSVVGAEALDFRDIHAFDAETAVAMSAGDADKGAARIYRTEDAGQSWKLVYQTHQKGAFLDGIEFWDKEHGIAFGDPIDHKFFVLTTSDGGKTWAEVPRDQFPPIEEGEAAFAASGTSLVVSAKSWAWIGTGGSTFARVFRSKDFGKSWEVAETPLPAGKTSGIFGLHFFNRLRGIAVGGDYLHVSDSTQNVIVTQDGGKTWQLLPSTNPPGLKEAVTVYRQEYKAMAGEAPVASVIERLITVGPSGTGYSINGGKTWNKLDDSPFHAVSFAGKDGWAVGAKGLIAKFEGFRATPQKKAFRKK
ncbi:WD40/YVTN/BNR-like repeat-containing protein [Siphonobacter sp.]|uniref:WD40/YVTN/BNR-like repeat-containing protein n=1 Tax=Siphonobacter sp. TaxID=1869184 RepID=UPI003B3AC1ED